MGFLRHEKCPSPKMELDRAGWRSHTHTRARTAAMHTNKGSMQIVVSSTSSLDASTKQVGLKGGLFYHHTVSSSRPERYAGHANTREPTSYLKFVVERYDTLPDAVAFVHEDVATHNPVWTRWLCCLRRSVDFASLSPVVLKHGGGSALETVAGLPLQRRGNPTCCLVNVQSRSTIRALPLNAYKSMYAAATGSARVDGKDVSLSAWDFEFQYHKLQNATPRSLAFERTGQWRDPCEHFRCELPQCAAKYVRYFAVDGPLSQGHVRKSLSSNQLQWENDVCGVRQLHLPERRWMPLSRVREALHVECVQVDLESESVESTSSPRSHCGAYRVASAYIEFVRSGCAAFNSTGVAFEERECLATSTALKSAKIALERRADCAVMRCWHRCCSACGERSWCKSWSWSSANSSCLLSEYTTVVTSESRRMGSYAHVVGNVMPSVSARHSAWKVIV